MKNLIFTLVTFSIYQFSFSQTNLPGQIRKNVKNIVVSVKFPANLDQSKIPKSAQAFFNDYLNVLPSDDFRISLHNLKERDYHHEHYDQYYNGIKVDGAGYNIHYKKGQIYFANGNYIRVKNINSQPTLSFGQAIGAFLNFKNIPESNVLNDISTLIIKEIPDRTNLKNPNIAQLVYKIYLESDDLNNNEIGYVNAHTGQVVLTEPRLTDLTGTFETLYNGSKQAETDPIAGGHRLFDDTRGADIHVRSLQNNTTFYGAAIELVDNDNNWTNAEHAANNDIMGLDVHWGLQEIWDYLNFAHSINSFDDFGEPILAYVRFGNTNALRDNAFWDPTQNVLGFGQGVSIFEPLASIDVVAHEFGHGITDFQIGWGGTFDQNAFNEGMSDIWAAIIEHRIGSSSVWRIGEEITSNDPYLRNLQYTNDLNSRTQIEDTFGTSVYNTTSDFYVRSGVFSHWFYILVNGEKATNGVGNRYDVKGIGFDMAEDLIVEAVFNNYLDGTTSYMDIRTAIIAAAETLFCEESIELKSVTDSWYAVGVGNTYQGNIMDISGPSLVCSSGSSFSVTNLPVGATLSWSSSSNLNRTSSQGSNPATFTSSNSYSGWIEVSIALSGICANNVIVRKNIEAGTSQIDMVTFENSADGEEYLCTSHYGNKYKIYPQNVPNTTYQYRLRQYPNLNVVYTSPTGQSDNGTITYIPPQGWYEFQVRSTNSCGTGNWIGHEVEYVDCSIVGGGETEYRIYPNPSSINFKISNRNSKADTTFQSGNSTILNLSLYDFTGNLVLQKNKGNLDQLNISMLKEGIYFLEISSAFNIEIHKIVIER